MKKLTTARGNKSSAVRQHLRSVALMNATVRATKENPDVEQGSMTEKELIASEYAHLLKGHQINSIPTPQTIVHVHTDLFLKVCRVGYMATQPIFNFSRLVSVGIVLHIYCSRLFCLSVL
jgi:hypothetical protein